MIVRVTRRETLLDFFADLAAARGEFLVYDSGFRSYAYTYADVARAVPRVRRAPAHRRPPQGRHRAVLVGEPPRVDRRALGLHPPGRGGRADRLPRIGGLPPPRARHREGPAAPHGGRRAVRAWRG